MTTLWHAVELIFIFGLFGLVATAFASWVIAPIPFDADEREHRRTDKWS